MADNITTFMCRLPLNLGAPTSWNPQDLSRPVQGLLYLYLKYRTHEDIELIHTNIYCTLQRLFVSICVRCLDILVQNSAGYHSQCRF